VVRFQHSHPIRTGREANAGNWRTASKLVILLEFLNSTFDPDADIVRVSNVEFIHPAMKGFRKFRRRDGGAPGSLVLPPKDGCTPSLRRARRAAMN
jgi:hypothetical protein